MRIKFLGATNTVTGSKYLLETGGRRLLVDCGLFQGYKQLRLRNWAPLPVAPASIDAVVLTHAHLDHSGYLPLLVKNGFRGKIYTSEASYDLCRILLPDSGRLQEEEANFANRHGYSRHAPAMPLYSEADAIRTFPHFAPLPFGKRREIADGLRVELLRAGHILGAASVLIEAEGRTVAFSGDLGRSDDPVFAPPVAVEYADYLVVESTYGDRIHDPADPKELLGRTIRETAARGGVVIIPSFAVGRAQILMHHIAELKQAGAIPDVLPVYLNSPMAIEATGLYQKHPHDHRLDRKGCQAMMHAAKAVNSVEESIALNLRRGPMVIIAGSGMATGGRVLHHLDAFVGDPRNTVLFAGFQAGGTRGALMTHGADTIKVHGRQLPVRAKVVQIDNLSAHADRDEILAWLGHFRKPPKRVFITHGEPDAADSLRKRIEQTLGWQASVPDYLDEAELA